MKAMQGILTQGIHGATAQPHWHSHGRKRQRRNWVQRPDLAASYQKTARPQATVRQWLCEEAQQLCIVLVLFTSGPECEWATWAGGQPRMKTHSCEGGQLGRSHATDIHQSGDDTSLYKYNKHSLHVCHFITCAWAENPRPSYCRWNAQTKHKSEMASHFYIPHPQRRQTRLTVVGCKHKPKTHEQFLQITQGPQRFGCVI